MARAGLALAIKFKTSGLVQPFLTLVLVPVPVRRTVVYRLDFIVRLHLF